MIIVELMKLIKGEKMATAWLNNSYKQLPSGIWVPKKSTAQTLLEGHRRLEPVYYAPNAIGVAHKKDASKVEILGDEIKVFMAARKRGIAVMLRGPTGTGKDTFVDHMAWQLDAPLVSTMGTEDTSVAKLQGTKQYGGSNGDMFVYFNDGLLTTCIRATAVNLEEGSNQTGKAIFLLNEGINVREELLPIFHSITDHNRSVTIEATAELLRAGLGFTFVVNYNPGYNRRGRRFSPAIKQRFVVLEFGYPERETEREIVAQKLAKTRTTDPSSQTRNIVDDSASVITALSKKVMDKLLEFVDKVRRLRTTNQSVILDDLPGQRAVINAACLMEEGISFERAVEVAIINPLTEPLPEYESTRLALYDLVRTTRPMK